MIDAKELRIGNWIKVVSDVEDYQTVDLLHLEECETFDCYKPIPLTTEILEKCGFSNHNRSVSFNDSGYDPKTFFYIMDGLDEFSQRIYRNGFIIGKFNDGLYYQANQRRNKGIKIESVHQLQNLYYALTGTELEITL